MTTRVLYLLGSAAPPVLDVGDIIRTAQGEGWDVCLGLTPTAACWLEPVLSGVRVLYGEGGFVPNEPGPGRPSAYPWSAALREAERVVGDAP
ncbi:hypothetical protein AB0A70_21835 [Streptomyces morookaense]|uniref:hypothetical protein n=1 Tax=Streptomyces morookaense TaxID=1970 RepID=UPI0033F2CACF